MEKGVLFKSLLPDPKTGKDIYFTVSEEAAEEIRKNPDMMKLLEEVKANV